MDLGFNGAMINKITKPAKKTYWAATDESGNVFHRGVLETNQVLHTGQPVLIDSTNETEHLKTVSDFSEEFDPLPDEGEPLLEGDIYSHGGSVYFVRQSHIRTEHDPNIVPALFFRYRINAKGAKWVEQEWVDVADTRTFLGVTYSAIQAHQTQMGWEPNVVPALWSVVNE